MPAGTVDGQRVTWHKGDLRRIVPTQTLLYEGQTFDLLVRLQKITVRGECWPDGRATFTRGYMPPQSDPPLPEHDESAEGMLQRIVDSAARAVDQRAKLRAALEESKAYTTPNASPASQRSMRSHSEKGKPSPDSAAKMEPPPPPKRASRGSQQQAATGAPQSVKSTSMPPPPLRPNAWASASSSLGRRQQAAAAVVSSKSSSSSASQPAKSMDLEEFPFLQSAAHPKLSTPSKPSPPNLMAAAITASSSLVYSSPQTDPKPRAGPAVTRAARAEGRGDITERIPTMEERLEALRPRGRIQRKQWLSEVQKHELKTALQRERREQAKRLQAACGVLMLELARYELPLVQLQLAEFAADPSNLAVAASMRWRFLNLYAQCCHTKHTDPVEGVLELPVLAAVLNRFKPARELLHVRLVAAKQILAESFTGAHRMGRVDPLSYKTLTEMRIKLFAEQRRDGATAMDLVGTGSYMPKLRVSKVKGKFTLEFRHQLHVHRHFSAKGSILSYVNAAETAVSGAQLFFELEPIITKL